MFFLLLPFILAEILIFTTWTHFYEFWNVFLAYFAPSILGALILSRTGQSMMASLRGGVVPGQMPGNALLHKGARVVGAILLMVPFFLSRVLAVLLLVPGLSHLSIRFFKAYLYKRISKKMSGFSFVKFGGMGGAGGPFGAGGPRGGPFGPGATWQGPEERQERDATVLDITPLEITHRQNKNEPPKK